MNTRKETFIHFSLYTLIMLAAVLLRLPGLYRDIWYDELSSITVATAPDFLAAARAYDHPPLYFALLRGWYYLSDSIAWLRLLSVIFSVGGCLVTIAWLRQRDSRIALTAGLLIATSPGLLAFSQEIRQYSLLVFFTACACFYLERMLAPNNHTPPVTSSAGLALSLALAIATHLVAVFLLPGLCIYALLRRRTLPKLLSVFGCTVPAVLTFLYLYVFFLEARSHSYETGWWMPAPTVQLVASNIAELFGFPQMSQGLMLFPAAMLPIVLIVFFGSAGLLCWAATYGKWRAAVPFLAFFAVSYGAIVLYSALFISVLVSRTVLFLILPLVASVATLLGTIEKKIPRTVGVLALVFLCALGATRWLIWESRSERIPWTALTEELQAALRTEGLDRYILTGYPFDARDMVAYKTDYRLQQHMLAPATISCENLLPAGTELYYVFHYRNFMPDAEVAEHEDFVKRMSDCGLARMTLFRDQGLELIHFTAEERPLP